MDHPRVENLAGLVDDFYCFKILLLRLMGLKLISKFLLAVKQVFPVLHVVGLEFVRHWKCSKKLSRKLKIKNQAMSGKGSL